MAPERKAMNTRPQVGIGITTYNRRDMLERTIDAVRGHTKSDHVIFVADDGSVDGTDQFLSNNDIAYISSHNRGIAWNKNRALFYLHDIRKCDVVILIEDDTYPCADGWDLPWVEGACRYGHLNLAPSHWNVNYLRGAGTPDAPYVSRLLTGQCSAFHRLAIETVGFMDSSFRRYGYEHVEHTHRMIRAGFGGMINRDNGELCSFLISSELVVEGLDKAPDMEGIAANAPILTRLQDEPLYRSPWRGDEEMALFRNELRHVVDSDRPSVAVEISEPDWKIICHTAAPLLYDRDAAHMHGNPDAGADDIPVLLEQTSEGALLAFLDPEQAWKKHWLRFAGAKQVDVVGSPDRASVFTLSSAPGEGFGLNCDGQFLCCDPDGELRITLSRLRLDAWETFRFGGYDVAGFVP